LKKRELPIDCSMQRDLTGVPDDPVTFTRVVNSNIEVLDWERKGPNKKMMPPDAPRVLKAVGSSDRPGKRMRLSLLHPTKLKKPIVLFWVRHA
jgi:hypothetical protein